MAVKQATDGGKTAKRERPPLYCSLPPQPPPALPTDLAPDRFEAILVGSSKWVNGTILHYWFFDGPEPQRGAVRAAFAEWKALGLGLEFREVAHASEAEVRVAFDQSDGSWSYVGRGILGHAVTEPTINYGWDLTDDYGHSTALHEIGHTLGLPHEHQNPYAGIVWDEAAVYADLGGPPNNWSRDQTFQNVLRKLKTSEVEGSKWDPNSVMEYQFGPGLIKEPAAYRSGIFPKGGLSAVDKQWVRKWYPAAAVKKAPPALTAFQSMPLMLKSQQQADFTILPDATREYTVATFGKTDTVMVLFEDVSGELRQLAADDDSGTDGNAQVKVKLFKGRRYVVRARLYWAGDSGQTALMYW